MSSTYIDVTWERMGPEFSYCVWYSKNNGPWVKHNIIRLTDEVIDSIHSAPSTYDFPNNTYRIDGLDLDTEYRIKVTCNDVYDYTWYSYMNYSSVDGGLSDSSIALSSAVGNGLKITFAATITGVDGFGHGEFGHTSFGGN